MKILHVITTIRRGGAENHLVELIKLQVINGYIVYVAYLKLEGYWKEEFEKIGVKVIALEIETKLDFLFNRKLSSIIKIERPDIVHAHLPPAELLTKINLLFKEKIPFIITKHNDKRFAPIFLENTLMKWVAKRANKIIAISGSVNLYFSKKGIQSSRIQMIHYGISPKTIRNVNEPKIREIKEEFNINEETIVFGTLSRLVVQKSLDTMIQGYYEFLKKEQIDNSLLIIVGRGDGKFKNEFVKLNRLVKKLNLQKKVILAGFRECAYEMLNVFDVFLLTSVHEGLGLSLLEAMASSTPIIATKVSAIPEVVGNGGILIPPNSPLELSQAMIMMLNSNVRNTYRMKGYQRVIKHFTLQKMFEKTHRLYAEVLQEK